MRIRSVSDVHYPRQPHFEPYGLARFAAPRPRHRMSCALTLTHTNNTSPGLPVASLEEHSQVAPRVDSTVVRGKLQQLDELPERIIDREPHVEPVVQNIGKVHIGMNEHARCYCSAEHPRS